MEYHLAGNLEPVKAIGNGIVIDSINNVLADRDNTKMVAYSINSSGTFDEVNVIFETSRKYGNRLSFRSFEYFRKLDKLKDQTLFFAEYAVGISEFTMEDFQNLQSFYQKSVKAIV
jgi:hypothetical protein